MTKFLKYINTINMEYSKYEDCIKIKLNDFNSLSSDMMYELLTFLNDDNYDFDFDVSDRTIYFYKKGE